MANPNPKIGLKKHARSPGSIANAEHNDPAGAGKEVEGASGVIKEVLADSTANTNILEDYAIIRVANTAVATAFVWIGQGTPPGAITIANGFALPPNSVQVFHCGFSDNPQESIRVKASAGTVQVVVNEV